MKRSFFALLTFFMIPFMNDAYSQLDTIHYIPPMHSTPTSGGIIIIGGGGGGNGSLIKKQYIYLSTPSTTPFDVTIKRGDQTILGTVTISNDNPGTYYVGTGQNTPLFVNKNNLNTVKTNKGIICEAPEPFYMSYRVNGGANTIVQHADWATGKGNDGLGTEFRVGGMPCFNAGTNNGHPRSITAGVMATQDNTVITLSDYDPAIKLFGQTPYTPPPSFSITLNAGETYTVALKHNNINLPNFVGVIGALVTADKPIALINGNLTGNMHPTNTANQDFAFDISVPTNKLGQDYIVVEGLGGPDMEKPMVIAHSDNTDIFVNGSTTAIATINAGDFYLIDNSNYQGTNHRNMYIRTSEPAYLYQMVAASPTGDNDGGMVLVPEINCFLPSTLDEIPSIEKIGNTTYNAGLTITTELGSTVELNGDILTNPEPVQGLAWETYKIDSNLVGHMEIVSSSAIAVSAMGVESPAGFAGYISGFVDDPDTSDFVAIDFCSAYNTTFESIYDMEFPADSVTWDFGDSNYASGDTVQHAYANGGTFNVEMVVHRCTNDTVSKTITINPTKLATFTPSICADASYTLPSGTVVNQTGIYIDTFATSLGCDSIITTDLTVLTAPNVTNVVDLCYGSTFTLPTGVVVSVSGFYEDTLSTAMGCDSIINTDLTINALITGTLTDSICEGEMYSLPSGPQINQTGIYTDIISAVNGCDSVITVDFKVNPLPVVDAGIDQDICPGDSVLLVADNPYNANITWSNGIVDGVGFEGWTEGTFTVYSELNGCTFQDDMTLSIYEIPSADFSYTADEPTAGGTEVSFYVHDPFNSDFSYFWTYGDGNVSNDYDDDHIYTDGTEQNFDITLTVTNQLGCSDSSRLTLEVYAPLIYYIPNAFTPNGDDYNNSFQPVFTSGFDPYDFHLTIFNRWGEIVFESYDASIGWDGTYGDEIVDDGVYIWSVQFAEDRYDKKYDEKGHVTVLK